MDEVFVKANRKLLAVIISLSTYTMYYLYL